MFLSRLKLATLDRGSQKLLSNPYLLHQELLLAFPKDVRGGGGRVMFRVEPGTEHGVVTVLMQSVLSPDLDGLNKNGKGKFVSLESKTFEVSLRAGQRLRFRLRANPTLRREGKRLGIFKEPEQLAWLSRKFDAGGLKLLGAVAIDEGRVRANRIEASGANRDMAFQSVRFEGVLEVVMAKSAADTIQKGLGAAKAFGFGMISVAIG